MSQINLDKPLDPNRQARLKLKEQKMSLEFFSLNHKLKMERVLNQKFDELIGQPITQEADTPSSTAGRAVKRVRVRGFEVRSLHRLSQAITAMQTFDPIFCKAVHLPPTKSADEIFRVFIRLSKKPFVPAVDTWTFGSSRLVVSREREGGVKELCLQANAFRSEICRRMRALDADLALLARPTDSN